MVLASFGFPAAMFQGILGELVDHHDPGDGKAAFNAFIRCFEMREGATRIRHCIRDREEELMGKYDLDRLWNLWPGEQITPEMASGHLLQNFLEVKMTGRYEPGNQDTQ